MKNNINFYEKGSVEILYGQSTHCFPLHSHESFCVGVITKGQALININNNECLLKEAMVFIVPSNTGISISADSEYSYITICFKNDLEKLVKTIKFNDYFLKLKSNKEILSLCDVFKDNNDEKQFLYSILKLVNSNVEPGYQLEKKQSNEIVLSISEYIKNNAEDKFNLEKLAKTFYLSKYHLIRIFKSEMGVTPNQYYIQAKLRIIKKEVDSSKSKTDLAIKNNLFDESHLYKLFKKQMGISIHDYKKNS